MSEANLPSEPAGLLARLASTVKAAFGSAPAGPAPLLPSAAEVPAGDALSALHAGLHAELRAYADKVTTAPLAAGQVRPGEHVFVGTACATPRALVAALEQLELRPADVELLHFFTDHAVPHNAQGEAVTNFRHRSFFVGADMRAAVKQGIADYVPMSIARLPALMAIGRVKVDVAFIQVSLPDAFGTSAWVSRWM